MTKSQFVLITSVAALLLGERSSLAEAYARPELLVESPELFAHIDGRPTSFSEAGVVLVSAGSESPEALGWLPGAKAIDLRDWKSAFSDGESAEAWSERIRRLIPNPKATVIVFDNGVTPNAARAWWLLRYWGLSDVRLLNADLSGRIFCAAAIRSMGFPELQPASEAWIAKPLPSRLATHAQVAGIDATTCLVDARTDREIAEGFIPGAEHADWSRFVDPVTGKMRPADELNALLEEVGFDPDKPAIAYCRSGGRASVVAFAMELMGGQRVANYYGSWNEWSQLPNAPIERPAVEAEP